MLKNILYIPLSWLYSLGVALRHLLYDQHLLPSTSVHIPTICVGNLAVGGTGKTPMVEYIVRLLTEKGFHVAVLSRGYKRKTRGFVLEDESATVRTIGDEPMQLHSKFPNIAVAVCENRVRGVHQLQKRVSDLDVVILDDAFQHRALRCGLNILLTPYDRLYIDDHMLPWGRLRDLPHRALKADAIVVTKCPKTIRPIDMRVVDNRLHLPAFQLLHFTNTEEQLPQIDGNPLVVCGIAQPQYLLTHVQEVFPKAGSMFFGDHHAYTPAEIETIVQRAEKYDFVLTTEKDFQRLQLLQERLQALNKPLVVVPINITFLSDQAVIDKQVLTYVRENNRKN